MIKFKDLLKESYKWKPSKSAAREFAQRMSSDENYRKEYEAKKEAKAEKRREGSQFDYSTAGGFYVPTQNQSDMALKALTTMTLTPEQKDACNAVMSGFSMNEKVSHDNIHVVDELIRSGALD